MSIGTVEAMIDWVETHIEEDPELAKMAQHVGYSEFYCSAKFHEYVGVPFKEYVFRRKLTLAAETPCDTAFPPMRHFHGHSRKCTDALPISSVPASQRFVPLTGSGSCSKCSFNGKE